MKYKNEIKRTKYENFKTFATEINDPWEFVNKALKSSSNDSIHCLLKEDGTYTTKTKETSELLLQKMFPDDNINDDNNYHTEIRNTVDNYMGNTVLTNFVPEIDISELNCIFEMIPFKSAPENLLPVVLQKCFDTLKEIIVNLFNKCLSHQYYPSNWKKGVIKVIKKPNKKDYYHHKSYRPITLLPVIGKWFSKIINKRLQWHSETLGWINENQFGFRKGKSCEKALINLTSKIDKCFETKSFALVISLDISGAFDNTWHPSILHKLIHANCHPQYIKLKLP